LTPDSYFSPAQAIFFILLYRPIDINSENARGAADVEMITSMVNISGFKILT